MRSRAFVSAKLINAKIVLVPAALNNIAYRFTKACSFDVVLVQAVHFCAQLGVESYCAALGTLAIQLLFSPRVKQAVLLSNLLATN